MAQAKTVNGILLLYHRPPVRDASTVMEHVASFRRYSEFRVWPVNTALGFPRRLREMRFRVIALHYSLMGFTPDSRTPVGLGHRFLDYLRGCDTSYKLAFFQDEHHYCQQRFALINQLRIDCVYTLLQPQYVKDVYGRYTCVPKVATMLTGYVSDTLLAKAQRYAKPDSSRKIDVGYRGRRLAPYMGKGALEKYEIALRFREAAAESGLRISIETEETKRLYGDA